MYDSDELRALAVAAQSGDDSPRLDLRQEMTPEVVLNLLDEIERMRGALDEIRQWSRAYPPDIFPTPDWIRPGEVLRAAGLSLDAISAANMRHVIKHVQKIVDAAMKGGGA